MKQITPEEFKQWLDEDKLFQLLDVRENWEHVAYNIGGLHIPMRDIITRKGEIPKDMPVLVYCEKGVRSTVAIQRLESFGYDNLYNLNGGVSMWKKIAD